MKKMVLILAMVMIAVGADAQAVIAEKDWSEMPVGWYDGCWNEDMPIVIEEGYLINSDPAPDANYWEPQVAILAHIDKLESGGQYQVKLTAESPCDGELRLDLCSWDGSGATKAVVVDVEKGLQEYTIDFLDYPTSCTDAMLFYQCGHLPGRNVVVKVQVIDLNGTANDLNGTGIEDGWNLVYEMNWEDADVYPFWDYGDILKELTDEGLAITNPDMQQEMWTFNAYVAGPAIPLEQGRDYLVRMTMKVPSDGTYHVALCSEVQTLGVDYPYSNSEVPVTASDDFQVMDVKFLDYGANGGEGKLNSDVVLCVGWVVGTTVIKKVEIYERTGGGTTAVRSLESAKPGDDAIYNLAGQRVDASYRGIVIRNGRKYASPR